MRKSVRRATVVLALTPVVALPTTLAYAGSTGNTGTTTVGTPAPPGDSSAVAAEVNGVITVAKTKAHAGSDGGTADADALTVLGQQVFGGSQQGVGSKGGNIIGTGDTPAGDAELAPWTAAVTNKNGGTQSAAEAALAHANAAGVAEVWVLHSKSLASWSPAASTGDSYSDGAEVSALGMLDVKVLHSEAHSTGKGHSDLLVVNDNEIGSSDQFNGMCSLSVPAVLDLICLTANGGVGKDGVTTEDVSVATFDVGGGALGGTVSGATASGGADSPASTPTPEQRGTTGGSLSSPGRPAAHLPAPEQAAALPFTGADTARAALLALATTMIGGVMTAFGRRRRLAVRA